MNDQVIAWNNADIEGFMQGYWKSDSLQFISKNGVTYGWQGVYDNYKKNYKTKDDMGILTFDQLQFKKLNSKKYLVIGHWHLQKEKVVQGFFSLIFEKIKSKWLIILDHTS